MIAITLDRQQGNLTQAMATFEATTITGDHTPESEFLEKSQGIIFNGYGQKAFYGCWTITFDSSDR